MGKKIVIEGFAHCTPAEKWQSGYSNCIDGFNYNFCYVQLNGDGFIPVGTATLTIECADEFDPRADVVEMLKRKRTEIEAEFAARVAQIDNQISQYTAIEYSGAAV